MDVFLEYIVPRKKGTKEILKIVGILLAMFVLMSLSTFLVLVPMLSSLMFLAFAAVIYGAYYLISSLNVEFEYIVTNGELDVDTIIHRRKRKRLVTVHSKTFMLLAPVDDPEHKNEENGDYARVIDASSGIYNEKMYYAVFSKDGQRIKLIFEPTEKMLDAFKTFNPRNVFLRK